MGTVFFFFNDTATTEIYTLSLHDALPISQDRRGDGALRRHRPDHPAQRHRGRGRSEEHTSELQSQSNLVCRLLLEKKKSYLDHRRLNDTAAGVRRLRGVLPEHLTGTETGS